MSMTMKELLAQQATPPASREIRECQQRMFDAIGEMRILEQQEKPEDEVDLREMMREWKHWNDELARCSAELVELMAKTN